MKNDRPGECSPGKDVNDFSSGCRNVSQCHHNSLLMTTLTWTIILYRLWKKQSLRGSAWRFKPFIPLHKLIFTPPSGRGLVIPISLTPPSGRGLVIPLSLTPPSGRGLVIPLSLTPPSGRALVIPLSLTPPSGRALVIPLSLTPPSGRGLVIPLSLTPPSGRGLVIPISLTPPSGRGLVIPISLTPPSGRGLVIPVFVRSFYNYFYVNNCQHMNLITKQLAVQHNNKTKRNLF